jgi:GTPase
MNSLTQLFRSFLSLFGKRKQLKIGLYGPPNGGKTTLANRICSDWLGEEMGSVSSIAHETRKVQLKETVTLKNKAGKELTFSLVDTPGIATKIDYEDFVKSGMKEKAAKDRAKEATQGVVESIKWLDEMDVVLIVVDGTKDPMNQVNITILGNLEARKIPVLVVMNKMDLRRASIKRVEKAFPNYKVIGISAKLGKNIETLYEEMFTVAK